MDESAPTVDEGTQNVELQNPGRRRLGRGLSVLMGEGGGDSMADDAASAIAGSIGDQEPSEIAIDAIERNPFQPRQDFDADSLNELANSIRQHGVLQPILVRPHSGGFQIIAGERRWRAAKLAGVAKIPCRVMGLEDRKMCAAALEENLKRKDLNVLEKAQAFQEYMARFDATFDDVGKQLSMARSNVCNLVRLLELADYVKDALRNDRVTYGHARALLRLSLDDQVTICKRIESEALSVRDAEIAIRDHAQQADPAGGTIPFTSAEKPAAEEPSNHVLSVQESLQRLLGLRIEIKLTAKEKGKVVITFLNNGEFEAILRVLRRAA
jgi:ParB family chromosome partitioning protein